MQMVRACRSAVLPISPLGGSLSAWAPMVSVHHAADRPRYSSALPHTLLQHYQYCLWTGHVHPRFLYIHDADRLTMLVNASAYRSATLPFCLSGMYAVTAHPCMVQISALVHAQLWCRSANARQDFRIPPCSFNNIASARES
jgi:hypothetical protein